MLTGSQSNLLLAMFEIPQGSCFVFCFICANFLVSCCSFIHRGGNEKQNFIFCYKFSYDKSIYKCGKELLFLLILVDLEL